MADRLLLERECEHGQMRPHGFVGATGMRNPCPGGERREVTVDYEAAATAYAAYRGHNCGGKCPACIWGGKRVISAGLELTEGMKCLAV